HPRYLHSFPTRRSSDLIADGTAEEIGQQLLLAAYMPAIHKAYAEVCQRFPALAAEDVAQQAALVLLEAARSPAMRNQNGYLPIADRKSTRLHSSHQIIS